MKPTIGRIVHYTTMAAVALGTKEKKPPRIRPALIVSVDETTETVALKIFGRNDDFKEHVSFTSEDAGSVAAGGQWTWPAREAPEEPKELSFSGDDDSDSREVPEPPFSDDSELREVPENP